jgi:hypothetical protein
MEVDDVDSNLMTRTRPASAWTVASVCTPVGAEGSRLQAPKSGVHGTGLSIAGTCHRQSAEATVLSTYGAGVPAGSAAFAGVRSTDLPVSPPRGAPV